MYLFLHTTDTKKADQHFAVLSVASKLFTGRRYTKMCDSHPGGQPDQTRVIEGVYYMYSVKNILIFEYMNSMQL